MRLIDADIADVVIIYDKSNELKTASEVREHIKRQKAFLDKFPTIDAVPVVRCRECKHHNKPPCPMRLSFNWTEDDDFCSYGERKEVADNPTIKNEMEAKEYGKQEASQ